MEVVPVVGMKMMILKEVMRSEGTCESHIRGYIFLLSNVHMAWCGGSWIGEVFRISVSTERLFF
jgi:hypothetical protein